MQLFWKVNDEKIWAPSEQLSIEIFLLKLNYNKLKKFREGIGYKKK